MKKLNNENFKVQEEKSISSKFIFFLSHLDSSYIKDYLKTKLSWHSSIGLIFFLNAYGILILYLCISQFAGGAVVASPIEEVIQIKPGMGTIEIGNLLTDKGLIKSSLAFQVVSLLSGVRHSLKAGDYALNTNMSIKQILMKITSGESVLYKFTVPEGFTNLEIAVLWEEKGFGTASNFTKALDNQALINKYSITTNSLEGYLFPNTYLFPRGISEQEAIDKMLSQFHREISAIVDKKSPEVNLSINDIISLASIIEKEAKVETERPIISAVFHNRLKSNQKLESCATVLYGLGYPNRKLTYDDLRDTRSLYNTYVYKGLPPGPICNPGLKSIIAALNPSSDKYTFFVSKNDGTHYFTNSYNDFLNAKRKYQGI